MMIRAYSAAFTLTLLTAAASLAFAQTVGHPRSGIFEHKHDVETGPGMDEATCRGPLSRWEGGRCIASASDSVAVFFEKHTLPTGQSFDGPSVVIDMYDNGLGGCSVALPATVATDGGNTVVRVSQPTKDYTGGVERDVTCEIAVRFLDADHVSSSSNGNCSQCGSNRNLEIARATRTHDL